MSLLVASGNGSSTFYDQGNSVPRLTADLRQVAVFASGDWAALSHSDTDLGSVSPPWSGTTWYSRPARLGQGTR